jgi:hypothetical protein
MPMSIQTERRNVERTTGEIAKLTKQLADYKSKETDKQKKINQIQRTITKNTSTSLYNSKVNQITRLQNEIANLIKKQADVQKMVSDKTTNLNRNTERLNREEDKERIKQIDLDKKRERKQLEHQRKITQQLQEQKALMIEAEEFVSSTSNDNTAPKKYDFFISHASEDKADFVRPLAEALQNLDVEVWYDELTLKVGDSLRKSIDKGLVYSRFGIVVISSSFIKKEWTAYELNGLTAKEMEGSKVILPIWHKVSKSEVMEFSPSLADKLALNSATKSVEEIAQDLAELLE